MQAFLPRVEHTAASLLLMALVVSACLQIQLRLMLVRQASGAGPVLYVSEG